MKSYRLLGVVLLAVGVSAQTPAPADALFAAIRHGDAGAVERALKSGISPEAVDADGTPAVMAAALFGDAHLLDVLLARHADPNAKGPGGTSALMWAVPDLAKVRSLLDHGAAINAKSETERTALLVAASYPRTVDLLKLLLNRGADLRAQDRGGATALSLAVRSADVDVVRFLVDRGLDPAALAVAERRAGLARWDRPTAEYLLAKAPAPAKEMLGAVATWQPAALVARWIDLGADINNAAPQYGRTPLMNAVASEAEGADTVKLLLDRGADPNARMAEGETPLDWAIYKGDRAKAEVLEQHGASRGNGPRREPIAPPAAGGIADPRVSLTKSVAQLLPAASTFRDKTNCISCHHDGLPSMAAATARRKGIAIDEKLDRKLLDDQIGFFKRNAARVMSGRSGRWRRGVDGRLHAAGDGGGGLSGRHGDRDHDALADGPADAGRELARQRPQSPAARIQPHQPHGDGGRRTDAAYPLPGRRSDMDGEPAPGPPVAARGASRRRPKNTGCASWASCGPARRGHASQRRSRPFAIGRKQAAAGRSSRARNRTPTRPASRCTRFTSPACPRQTTTYRKGVAFLLGSQYQDGAWLVRTHSFPTQRYFESGFPFGRHQWISAAGTSWAALAIAQTLPDTPR